MAELGYEIKHGKHIAFKPKDKAKFTRAKTIGEDYTEERLKERITKREYIKTPAVKKRIGTIIDMNTNTKVKESKGYEYWATKHNLNTMAESVIFIREHGIKSVRQLDEYIQKTADERQHLQDKIKAIDKGVCEGISVNRISCDRISCDMIFGQTAQMINSSDRSTVA